MLLIFAGVLLIAGLVSNKSRESESTVGMNIDLDDDPAELLKETKASDDSPAALLNATRLALQKYVNSEDGEVQEHIEEANSLFEEVRFQFVTLRVSPLPQGLAGRMQALLDKNFKVQQGWTRLAKKARNFSNQPIEHFREAASPYWRVLGEIKLVFSQMSGVNAHQFNALMKKKEFKNFQTNIQVHVDQSQDHFYKQTLNLQKNYDQRQLNFQQNIDERTLNMTQKNTLRMYDQSQQNLGLSYAPTNFIQQGYPDGGPAPDPYDPNWSPSPPDRSTIDFNSSPDNLPPPPPGAGGVAIFQDSSTPQQFDARPLADQRRETKIKMQEIVTPSDAIKPFDPKPSPDDLNPLGGFDQVPRPPKVNPIPVVQPTTAQHQIDQQIRLDMRDTEKPKRTRDGTLKSNFNSAPSEEKQMEEMIQENKKRRPNKADEAFNQTKRKVESAFVVPSRPAEGVFADNVDRIFREFSNRLKNKQYREAQAVYGKLWDLCPSGGSDGNVIIVRGNTQEERTYPKQDWLDYLEWRLKEKMDVWSRASKSKKDEWRELNNSADADKQFQKLKLMKKELDRRAAQMPVGVF